jgi:hypothetical protein
MASKETVSISSISDEKEKEADLKPALVAFTMVGAEIDKMRISDAMGTVAAISRKVDGIPSSSSFAVNSMSLKISGAAIPRRKAHVEERAFCVLWSRL